MPDVYAVLLRFAAGLVLLVLTFVAGCQHGQKLESGQVAKRDLGAVQTEIRRADAASAAVSVVATASAEAHEKIVTRYQTIEKEVIRYVQTPVAAAVCLDDDGLRIWTAANRGEFEAAGTIGAGHAPLPGDSAPTGDRTSGRPAGEPRAGDAPVAGVRSAADGAGELRQGGEAGAAGSSR